MRVFDERETGGVSPLSSLLSPLQSGRAGHWQCLQWLVVAGWVAARVSRSGWWRLLPQTSKQDSEILSCHAAFLHSNTVQPSASPRTIIQIY